ncbi:hypothetical protein K437DRAFT_271359 [Tilletiaria anomala UBC 951]|uniref:Uncharacterized protein n=1 Tax=Tilletiaria anomala (strain ATCC 24038 / CBS 436.72 / UBC 951) TaxID=1037660 RepID=A0A066V0E7_TILAU|nr:uncharacterized protein K437DRAFT_271359 [Tilletiaria anomala UBC 951]KDN35192.1 hypothetical protein K437DRAFT_271359 [Tilletiaria anomala UBC 951]
MSWQLVQPIIKDYTTVSKPKSYCTISFVSQFQAAPLVFNQIYGFNSGEPALAFVGSIVAAVLIYGVFCPPVNLSLRAHSRSLERKSVS